MKAYRYTLEMIKWIQEYTPGHTRQQITDAFNERFNEKISRKQIDAAVKNYTNGSGLRKNNPNYRRLPWNQDEINWMKENVPGKTRKKIVDGFREEFGDTRSDTAIIAAIKRYTSGSGIDSKFKKGQPAFNKGQKMSAEQYKKCKRTMFKPGNVPHNYHPVGTVLFSKGLGYWLIKTEDPGKWELYHRYLWEKENGPIPEGYCVTFLDGNVDNLDISNMALARKGQLTIINQNFKKMSAEGKAVALNMAKLQMLISERSKLKCKR